MADTLLQNESTLRLTVFLLMLGGMAAWELASPRRRVEIPRLIRWTNNLALVALDTAILRIAFPVLAVGVAAIAADNGWGLFNMIETPSGLALIVSFLLLDLAIYAQHVVFHYVPWLWRLHRMHHADLEFDTTTGIRFHPIEILLSMLIKMAVVIVLGAPPVAVLVFEVVLNATSLFNHGNVRLSPRLDAVIRRVLVTPDMHRVHHSTIPRETNSNFGFNLPWWDWIFGTYIAQPGKGHEGMEIGIEKFRTRRDLWLDRMLVQPFVEEKPPAKPTSSNEPT